MSAPEVVDMVERRVTVTLDDKPIELSANEDLLAWALLSVARRAGYSSWGGAVTIEVPQGTEIHRITIAPAPDPAPVT